MFKKIQFKQLDYKDLDRYGANDHKRDEMQAFYQTFDFLDLIKMWPDIVGPQLAQVTSPLRIKFDALFIVTRHPSYSQHLFDLSEMFKEKIFASLPELRRVIKKLEFITQESFFKEMDAKKEVPEKLNQILHPQSPVYKKKMLEAQRLFEHIEDDELKKILTSLYLQN